MASTTIKSEPEDNNICRLCLSEEALDDIFKEQDLRQWISDYLSITVSTEDSMSRSVCAICRIRMVEFNQFRTRCREVQDVLQQRLIQNENFKPAEKLSAHQITKGRNKRNKPGGELLTVRQTLAKPANNQHKTRTDDDQQQTFDDLREVKTEPCDVADSIIGTSEQRIEQKPRRKKGRPCKDQNDGSSEAQKTPIHQEPTRYHGGESLNKNSCSKCNRKFHRKCILEAHMKTHHKEDKMVQMQWKCNLCKKIYNRQASLISHRKKVHETKRYYCQICGGTFRTRSGLRQHLMYHFNGDDEEFNSPQEIEAELERLSATSVRIKQQCSECGEIFNDQKSLSSHYKMAHENKLFKCSICSTTLASKTLLKKHMSVVHKQPSTCNLCNMVFKDRTKFKEHILQHAPKNHCCKLCGKLFRTSQSLKKHQILHSEHGDSHASNQLQCNISSRYNFSETHKNTHENSELDSKLNSELLLPDELELSDERLQPLDELQKNQSEMFEEVESQEHKFELIPSANADNTFESPHDENSVKRENIVETPIEIVKMEMETSMGNDASQASEDGRQTKYDKLFHGSKDYKCHICGVVFSLVLELRMHEKSKNHLAKIEEKLKKIK